MDLPKTGALPPLDQIANPYYNESSERLGMLCRQAALSLHARKQRSEFMHHTMMILAAASYRLNPEKDDLPRTPNPKS